MFEIDGSQKSGSGTILRLALALAAIQGEPLHIINIRQNRPQRGLKPQHLEAVVTAAKLCNAEYKGAELGSRELYFIPDKIQGGDFEAEIGTAGSIPMLLMTALPICLFAKKTTRVHVIKGGTETSHAPTINYLRNVFLPALKNMGIEATITVQKYGYYPKGMGEATLQINPPNRINPIKLEDFGKLLSIQGISICTFLSDRNVAERQARAAKEILAKNGHEANIQIVNDSSNPLQKGSSMTLWAKTDTNVILGADSIGEPKKTSEAVGSEAAQQLLTELTPKPTVDVHLADMLIPYIALANGSCDYLTRAISDHTETNIWLAQTMLNTPFKIEKKGALFKIQKAG